jgi:threonine/homoserine/homoserine lactone efflux protein
MVPENLTAFFIAAFALTGSPGPATLGLSAASAAFGLRASLVLMTGIIAGVLVVFAAAAAGLTGLILTQPLLGPAVKALSALYMVWLAWSIASAPPSGAGGQGGVPTFWGGVFLGVGNPKAYAAMAALSSGFVLAADRPTDAAL